MRTKRCAFVAVVITGLLLISSDIIAQRGYRRGYSRHYPVRHYSARNYYYSQPFVSIRFGGIGYRYQRGYYYRPYGASLRLIIPPIGIRISTLPPGYRRIYVGPSPYYYYGGVYYRPYAGNQYEVVSPPLGAVVHELPPTAKATVIDGIKYYEHKGTYFKESVNDDNEVEYTVVGTDGVLDTATGQADAEPAQSSAGPRVGDRLEQLPADSREVVIKGEKLYLSPSGLYYKEVTEAGKTLYEVVGK